MTIRDSFAERFGEDNAVRVEEAALGHMGGPFDIHKDDSWGEDPFKYILLLCIGHDCFTRWRTYHGITASYEEIHEWVLEYGDLNNYAGSIPDYMALIAGAYAPWIRWPEGEEPEAASEWRERNLRYAHMSDEEHRADDEMVAASLKVMAEDAREFFNKTHEEGPL